MRYQYFVYIMTNKTNNVLYTGVTNNLERRVWEHKTKQEKGFTAQYNCNKLVYFEETDDVSAAIEYEKKIKGGSRQKKIELIQEINPQWEDLSDGWFDEEEIASRASRGRNDKGERFFLLTILPLALSLRGGTTKQSFVG